MPGQPINRDARALSVRACNASRKRRFATDPAKQRWYAEFRSTRFVRHFGG